MTTAGWIAKKSNVPEKREVVRSRALGLALWLTASVVFYLAVPARSASSRSLIATVQHVADGDSVTAISDNGTKLRIRLLGIEAPEVAIIESPASPLAKKHGTISTT